MSVNRKIEYKLFKAIYGLKENEVRNFFKSLSEIYYSDEYQIAKYNLYKEVLEDAKKRKKEKNQ